MLSVETITTLAKEFWQKIAVNWKELHHSIIMPSKDKLQAGSLFDRMLYSKVKDLDDQELLAFQEDFAKRTLAEINEYLGELQPYCIVELTFGECNRQSLPDYHDTVCFYLSPKISKKNLTVVELLYRTKPNLTNLFVAKYRPYYLDDPIEQIEYPDGIVARYEDFGFQGSVSYAENGKPLLNIVIVVRPELADKILTKKKIYFKSNSAANTDNHPEQANHPDQLNQANHPDQLNQANHPEQDSKDDSQVTSREVYAQDKHHPIDAYIINIIGEYNIIHHVGYIEILHGNDSLVNSKMPNALIDTTELTNNTTELIDMRNNLDIILASYNYKKCNYCSFHALQVELFACKNCKTAYYCGRKCQKLDWTNHKLICNK